MDKYFTEHGLRIREEAKEYGLYQWYDDMCGNFGFTENELFENMNKILMWLEKHIDYKLLYQNNKVADNPSEELVWWLTDFEE